MAKVEFYGIAKTICVEWIDNVKEGDYILAHAGMAISVIDEKTALETLEDLKHISRI